MLSEVTIEALEAELTTLAGHLNAGNYRFLRLLAEFERREGYAGFGIMSCAHWPSWKCGIGLVAAREIAEAMRAGQLSYCKARAITRVATPANESLLLSIAENGTVTHVEKTVRLFQRGTRAEQLEGANALHEARYAQCYFDERDQLIVRAQLPPEQGALFMKALQVASEVLWEAEDASREAPEQPDAAARKADALASMAETVLAHGVSAGERPLVTVHVAEEVLRDPSASGQSQVEGEAPLPPATVRRLCCDGWPAPSGGAAAAGLRGGRRLRCTARGARFDRGHHGRVRVERRACALRWAGRAVAGAQRWDALHNASREAQ